MCYRQVHHIIRKMYLNPNSFTIHLSFDLCFDTLKSNRTLHPSPVYRYATSEDPRWDRVVGFEGGERAYEDAQDLLHVGLPKRKVEYMCLRRGGEGRWKECEKLAWLKTKLEYREMFSFDD